MKSISNIITKNYDDYLSKMREDFRVHYSIRMYRYTGDSKYLPIIQDFLNNRLSKIIAGLKKLHSINDRDISITDNVRSSMRRNKIESKRVARREEFYQQNPKLKYYFESLSKLSLLVELNNFINEPGDEIEKIIKIYRNFDWKQIFIKIEHLKVHPVLFINSIYRLRNLNIANYLEALESWTDKQFPTEVALREIGLYDQVYTYTHIIINETDFYQHHIPNDRVIELTKYFDFFETNFDSYFKKVNLDLHIEILLCYQLAKLPMPSFTSKIEEYLLSHFDKDSGFIKTEAQDTIEDMEHANVLFLMYNLNPKKFFSFPSN